MVHESVTELEIEVEVKRHTERDELQEIIHAALVDAFEKDFREFEWEFDVGEEVAEIEMEIADENSYRKTDHYKVAKNLINAIHETGFEPVSISHETYMKEYETQTEEQD